MTATGAVTATDRAVVRAGRVGQADRAGRADRRGRVDLGPTSPAGRKERGVPVRGTVAVNARVVPDGPAAIALAGIVPAAIALAAIVLAASGRRATAR